jgi:molecular chaperone DnaK (HSP70)
MKKIGMDDPKMLKMLQEKIDEDEKAGLNVLGLISGPSAAALAYGATESQKRLL